MKLPEDEKRTGSCKLNYALYCLKQAGRMWNETLNKTSIKLKFERFKSDPYIYIMK